MSLTDPAAAPQYIDGLGEVAGFYEGIILDLWGCLHDGVALFPETLDALKQMKRAKRRVWLLSNAPRRAHLTAQFMEDMGIPENMYDGIMTSGEAAFQALHDRYLEEWGRNCYHLGSAKEDGNMYDGLDINIVDSIDKADFILATGVERADDTADKYAPVLQAGAEKNIPLLCANPDRIVHVGENLVLCPGTFADMYEQLDGQVTWLGKPYKTVYRLALEGLGTRKVIAVGDGMMTDIEGATGAGLDSVLITAGIHREAFFGGSTKAENGSRGDAFLKEFPYRPTYLMSGLRW
ncbi:MAG: TIGR01459 family HAD-type hydrolase [Micavibrio sp.]|nr:TIGR01459 family HAD-type hydrolase [Micavibrio sp.]